MFVIIRKEGWSFGARPRCPILTRASKSPAICNLSSDDLRLPELSFPGEVDPELIRSDGRLLQLSKAISLSATSHAVSRLLPGHKERYIALPTNHLARLGADLCGTGKDALSMGERLTPFKALGETSVQRWQGAIDRSTCSRETWRNGALFSVQSQAREVDDAHGGLLPVVLVPLAGFVPLFRATTGVHWRTTSR